MCYVYMYNVSLCFSRFHLGYLFRSKRLKTHQKLTSTNCPSFTSYCCNLSSSFHLGSINITRIFYSLKTQMYCCLILILTIVQKLDLFFELTILL